jgi:hypothetical protein
LFFDGQIEPVRVKENDGGQSLVPGGCRDLPVIFHMFGDHINLGAGFSMI